MHLKNKYHQYLDPQATDEKVPTEITRHYTKYFKLSVSEGIPFPCNERKQNWDKKPKAINIPDYEPAN